jgi:hypothetical protein
MAGSSEQPTTAEPQQVKLMEVTKTTLDAILTKPKNLGVRIEHQKSSKDVNKSSNERLLILVYLYE